MNTQNMYNEEITIESLAVMINNGFREAHQNLIDAVSLLATKEELANFATETREKMSKLATKEEVSDLREDVLKMKKEMSKLATKEEIAKLATKEEISKFATRNELIEFKMDLKKEIWESVDFVTNKMSSQYGGLDARVRVIESKMGLEPA